MSNLIHDSHSAIYRNPTGPARAGSVITLRFSADDAAAVTLRTWMGEETLIPMKRNEHGLWSAELQVPKTPGLLWYDFYIDDSTYGRLRYGAPEDGFGGVGRVYENGLHSFQLTVYDPSFQTPAWMHGANIYQIFPDRFYRAKSAAEDQRTDRRMHDSWDEDFFPNREGENGSMDFWGGTINGIREKLPYIRDLGATVIYLNPVFQAHSNHRYDTGDYTRVDELLGTNEELEALFSEAREMGIRILLDGVFSHTGDDSIYFNSKGRYDSLGAAQSKASPYYSWYTFEHWPDKYRCWWGVTCLPECRKNNASYQRFMFNSTDGIVPRWLNAGASGWRLDVADELSMDFLRKLRRSAKRAKKDALVLGEVWEDASNKFAYNELRCYCTGDTLDSVMNYPLRQAILDFVMRVIPAGEFVRRVEHQAEVYPAPFLYSLMNLLGSHDRARALNMFCGKDGRDMTKKKQAGLHLTHDEYEVAVRRYRVALDLLCALPGCPTIYYGDEAGMTGTADPYCRRPYPWGHEDTSLRDYVAAKLNHRRNSSLLQTGFCEMDAVNDDTVRIRRFMRDGRDALGHKSTEYGMEVFTIQRP